MPPFPPYPILACQGGAPLMSISTPLPECTSSKCFARHAPRCLQEMYGSCLCRPAAPSPCMPAGLSSPTERDIDSHTEPGYTGGNHNLSTYNPNRAQAAWLHATLSELCVCCRRAAHAQQGLIRRAAPPLRPQAHGQDSAPGQGRCLPGTCRSSVATTVCTALPFPL